MTLRLENVSKRVGTDVHIHPTDLTLQPGSMNVLLGRTLAGKTTLMRIMAGLDVPTAGRVHWNGEDVTGRRVQDRDVSMVYQQFINYPSMSVYDNIASPLRLQKVPASEISTRVHQAAELVKLDASLLQRRPLELSGGQQQRCALARALVKDAQLVLLDEPLANLDYKLREELRAEIPKIFEASGAIFVYATTEPHEALLLGGNTACLWEGEITQFGPAPEVYRNPSDWVTAQVYSDPPMNFVPVTVQGGIGQMDDGTRITLASFAGLSDGRYNLGFRANHLRLAPVGDASLGFAGEVSGTEITGSESFVHITTDAGRWVALVDGIVTVTAGEALSLHVDPNHVYVFDEAGAVAATAHYVEAA